MWKMPAQTHCLAPGSAQCLKRSNANLSLLIDFAVAGLALVALITLCDFVTSRGVSLFGGLEWTTGLLEWTTGTLEWTTGILEWLLSTYLTRCSGRWGLMHKKQLSHNQWSPASL